MTFCIGLEPSCFRQTSWLSITLLCWHPAQVSVQTQQLCYVSRKAMSYRNFWLVCTQISSSIVDISDENSDAMGRIQTNMSELVSNLPHQSTRICGLLVSVNKTCLRTKVCFWQKCLNSICKMTSPVLAAPNHDKILRSRVSDYQQITPVHELLSSCQPIVGFGDQLDLCSASVQSSSIHHEHAL